MTEAEKIYLHSCVTTRNRAAVMKVVMWDIIMNRRHRIREILGRRKVLIYNITQRRSKRGKLTGESSSPFFSFPRSKVGTRCSWLWISVLAIPLRPGADYRSMSVRLSGIEPFDSPSHVGIPRFKSGSV